MNLSTSSPPYDERTNMKRSTKYKIKFKNLIQFLKDSFDDFITIVLWVMMWSIVEPYILGWNVIIKILIVILLIVFLNKRLLKFPKKTKRRKGKPKLKEVLEKLDNLELRL